MYLVTLTLENQLLYANNIPLLRYKANTQTNNLDEMIILNNQSKC